MRSDHGVDIHSTCSTRGSVKLLWERQLSPNVLPILLRAILYSLQYLYSFPPIVRLFYLTRCLHPYLLLSYIQPGVLFTYDYPNPLQYTIKFFAVNSITFYFSNLNISWAVDAGEYDDLFYHYRCSGCPIHEVLVGMQQKFGSE